MRDRARIWVLDASGGSGTRTLLEEILNIDEPWWTEAMIAPWNTSVSNAFPPGGIGDTDWGIVSNAVRSVRWRSEPGRLAFSMVSETDPEIPDAEDQASVEVSRIDYLVDGRYRNKTGVDRIREIRYESDGVPAIRYELLEGGSV